MYQARTLVKLPTSCSKTDYLLSVGTPLLAACSICCSLLALATTKPTRSDYLYLQLVLCLSGLVLLWWCTSIFCILRSYRIQQKTHQRYLNLPSWIPTCLKNCSLALLGVSIICTPAQAYSPNPTATAITCVEQDHLKPLEHEPVSAPLTTLFTSKTSQHYSPEKTSSVHHTQNSPLHHVVLSTSEKEYVPLTPLFGVTTSTRNAEPKSDSKDYVVRKGDTLWSIAQTYLGEEATPRNTMEYSYRIYQHNQEHLRGYEAPIYPGEILVLPSI
ncbi:LysM peptidoglycan-binding domain-containing protein [Rothia sp. P7208]|uniref:LysM peptidoglycan-binding domain-containing protein n=1 Tax=Rothia sp. P7208 TaxID=3402660 RepID=UPI003AC8C3AB